MSGAEHYMPDAEPLTVLLSAALSMAEQGEDSPAMRLVASSVEFGESSVVPLIRAMSRAELEEALIVSTISLAAAAQGKTR